MKKKRIISVFMSVILLIGVFGTMGVNAEGFTELKGAKFLDNNKAIEKDIKDSVDMPVEPVFQLSFANGIQRVFNENKKFVKLYDLDNENVEVEIELEVMEDSSQDISKSKSLKLKPVSKLKSENKYQIFIAKEFKANNNSTLKEDIRIDFTTVKEETTKTVEEKVESVDVTAVEVKEEKGKIKEEIKIPFTDIKDNKAKDSIKRMYRKGFVKGKSNNLLAPDDNITMAEVMVLVSRVLDLKDKEDIAKYDKLASTAWYTEDVLKILKAELIEEDKALNINDNVKLEEIIKMALNAYKYNMGTDDEINIEFKDIEVINIWVKEVLEKTYGEDIMIETEMNLSRGQFIAILDGLVSIIEK